MNNAQFVAQRMYLTPEDILVLPVPMYHCFGLVLGKLTAMSAGTQILFPSALFDASACLHAVHQSKATALHGVPTMYIEQLNHPNFEDFDYSNLRTGIMAGSNCPEELLNK